MGAALPSVVKDGREFPWIPLHIKTGLANTAEDIDRNIESALKRDCLKLMSIVGTESGAVSIVGSGPSLKENWRKLVKTKGDIIACNAAYQFLLERGVVAKYMFCFDADPLMLEFFRKTSRSEVTPHKDTTFLIGSRCPPETFDLLKEHRVIVWHAAGDEHIEAILQKHGRFDEPMVIGGTAAITRCMVLAQTLGYKTIHLWGADSSFANGETHIRQSTTVEKRMAVGVGGRSFETSPWMAQQAEDFKVLAPPLRDFYGIKFIVHGDGLIPHLARIMGFQTDFEPRWKHSWRVARYRTKQLWNQL